MQALNDYDFAYDEYRFQLLLSESLGGVYRSLRKLGATPAFVDKICVAFGDSLAPDIVVDMAQNWSKGDINLPLIEILPSQTLKGAYGGYASTTNTIYLSKQLLSQNDPLAVTNVILEEFGHSLDTILNNTDTLGDEGQIFAALAQGIFLTELELKRMREENDIAKIFIDGEEIQIEMAAISGNGGKGGTTKDILLESEGLNLVQFEWENFQIPDEFQILYEGIRIAGNAGLQKGGGNGEKIVTKKAADKLTVKVTAPLEGTLWTFNVQTLPLEININGLLGDVVEVDLKKEFEKRGVSIQGTGLDPSGFGLKTNSNNRGQVALIDNWQAELLKGRFYFVPSVNGTPLQFGQARNDNGLGESTLMITNGDIVFPVKFNIVDGFSSTVGNRVTSVTQKLDIYEQEQRLAYLGFPQQSGDALTVNGQNDGNELSWAISLFDAVIEDKNKVEPVKILGKKARGFINVSNAPRWNEIRVGTIQGVDIKDGNAQTERWATDWALRALKDARTRFGRNLTLNGATLRPGNPPGSAHQSHGAGRDLDIDTPPREAYNGGRNFFLETRINNVWYVAAPNKQIIVKNSDGTYQATNPIIPVPPTPGNPGNPGNLVNAVTGQEAFNNREKLSLISNYLVDNTAIDYNLANVKKQIQSFIDTGLVARVLHNDPRLWSATDGQTGIIRYSSQHNGHVHYDIGIPVAAANNFFNLQSLGIVDFSPEFLLVNPGSLISPLASVLACKDLSNAIDLGQLEGNVNLTGSIDSTNSDIYYRFTLGKPIEEDEDYFFNIRDFSLLLNGLSADADVELVQDFNGDNIRQDYEVVASSEEIGNSNESINITDLSPNIYYVRVLQKSGDTNYNLTLSTPPLPVPTDNAGNIGNTAKDLGIIGNAVQLSDFIGEVDTDDYYRFTASSTRDLNIDVTGLSNGDLSAELGQDKNKDGTLSFEEVIASSDEEGDTSEKISVTGLAAGEYILHLGQNSGSTNYYLRLSAPLANIPTDKAGNTSSTAFDIGSLNTEANFSDFVGNVDPEDFYRFTLANVSGLKIQLSGLSADADLELAQDTNNNGVIDSNEIINTSELQGTSVEAINIFALAAGTYFVRVHQYDGDTDYNLSLTPTTPVGSDLSVTKNETIEDLNLGERYTYQLFVENTGPSTAHNVILSEKLPPGFKLVYASALIPTPNYSDYLRFQLNAGDRVIIDLDTSGFGSDLDSAFALLDSARSYVVYNKGDTASNDSYLDFTAKKSDTYILEIFSQARLYYDEFIGDFIYSGSSGGYTVNITIGNDGSTTQAVLDKQNDNYYQPIDTNLSSATPGTFIGTGFIRGFPNVDNGIITSYIGKLESGEHATIEVTGSSFISGDLLSSTSVTSNELDYKLSNNFLLSSQTIKPITPPAADLELTQSVNNSYPRIGDQVTIVLTLTNRGPGTATVIKVGDILPAGLSYVTSLADLGSYDNNTGIWAVGNMPPNESVRLLISAAVNSGQLLTNVAEIISVDEDDPDSTPNNNNTSEDDQSLISIIVQNVGIELTAAPDLATTESGGTATFSVRLNSQPTADVIIGLSSSDTTEGTLSISSLAFTAANWNIAQTVTVTGADDPIIDGNIAYSILTDPAVSTDATYNGFKAPDISLTNIDNDVRGSSRPTAPLGGATPPPPPSNPISNRPITSGAAPESMVFASSTLSNTLIPLPNISSNMLTNPNLFP